MDNPSDPFVDYARAILEFGRLEQELALLQRVAEATDAPALNAAADDAARQIQECAAALAEARLQLRDGGRQPASVATAITDAAHQLAICREAAVQQLRVTDPAFSWESTTATARVPATLTTDGEVSRPLFLGWGWDDDELPYLPLLGLDACLHRGEHGTEITADGELIKADGYDAHVADLAAAGSSYYIRTGFCEHDYQVAPDWWLERHTDDPDVFSRNCAGVRGAGQGRAVQLNIWHPDVREHVRTYSRAWAAAMGNEDRLLFSLYGAEPHLTCMGGGARAAGYSDAATAAFHAWLQDRFGLIEALNDAWQSRYEAFADIPLPPDPTYAPRDRVTPLIHEFERFRRHSFLEFFELHYHSYKAAGATKPLVLYGGGGLSLFGADTDAAIDPPAWFEADIGDVYGMHINSQWTNVAQTVYHYSLNRHFGKTLAQLEYIWSYPRHPRAITEDHYRAVGAANTFRQLAWGKAMFTVFGGRPGSWSFYRHDFYEYDVPAPLLLRPCMRWLPVMQELADRLWPILRSTQIAPAQIAVLQPSTSLLNVSPSTLPRRLAENIHDMLFPRNYRYFFVPEEHILNGRESLAAYRLLVLPGALHFPEGLTERLRAWIAAGGTLIALRWPGQYDRYGNADGGLLRELFGTDEPAQETAAASYGRGRVLLVREHPWFAEAAVMEAVAAAVQRDVWCDSDGFELTLRRDEHDDYFLFVLNPDHAARRCDTIHLAGIARDCIDITIGSGAGLPTEQHGGSTRIPLSLAAGEGTVLRLGAVDWRESGEVSIPQPPDLRSWHPRLREVSGGADLTEAFAAWALRLGKGVLNARACGEAVEALAIAFDDAAPIDVTIPGATAPPALDGTLSDWASVPAVYLTEGDDPQAVENEYGAPGEKQLAEHLGCFQLQWDADNLYVAFTVNCDTIWNPYHGYFVWGGDVVDLFVDLINQAPGDMSPLAFHLQLTPTGEVVPHNWYGLPMAGIRAAVGERDGGYSIECAIPHAVSQIVPAAGFTFSLNVRMADVAPGGANARAASWKSTAGLARRPDRNVRGWGRVRLV